MSKREGALKSQLREALEDTPGFHMLQLATRGAPDRLIVGNGRTTFWEAKHGTPDFLAPGDQTLMCMRLAVAGYCRYIIWQSDRHGNSERTMIVHPRVIHERTSWSLQPEAWCVGFDQKWLTRYILKVHGL